MVLLLLVELVDERGDEAAIVVAKELVWFVYAESKSKTPQRRVIDEETTYLQGSDGKYRDGHETAWRADIWAFRVASWVATHVWTLSIVYLD